MFRSLWTKIAASFVLVAIMAVGLVAVVANRATTREFGVYVSQGKQRRAERLAPELAAYYAQVGSWAGVEPWLDTLSEQPLGTGRRAGAGQVTGTENERLLLASPEGQVLADSEGELAGQVLSSAELAHGTSVEVEGRPVAVLLLTYDETALQGLEAQFLERVNRSLWIAGAVAAGLALLLGLLLAWQLTAPLRDLTLAAGRLAEPSAPGEVPQVRVVGGDEIARLGHTFNRMARSLAHQQTLRRNLMADVAHELRTPLSVIRSDLEAILDGVYQPSSEVLASLHEESLLLSRLVDDLRALAQAEAGQLRLERQPTDLADLLRGALAGLDCPTPGPRQALCLDLAPNLPLVDTDPQRVRQVVANLVTNAQRHAPESGQVLVSAMPHQEGVVVAVVDDGPGIPPQDLPHLFDRFWRGGAARSEGSGLGLAIARELVRAHGGQIWAESQPGQGAAFYFTLPAARPDDDP